MESWHVVGQKVVQKHDRPWLQNVGWKWFKRWKPCGYGPQHKQVYTINRIGYSDDFGVLIMLSEISGHDWYTASSFAPVQTTSIECFRSLLTPTPSQVRELEDA